MNLSLKQDCGARMECFGGSAFDGVGKSGDKTGTANGRIHWKNWLGALLEDRLNEIRRESGGTMLGVRREIAALVEAFTLDLGAESTTAIQLLLTGC